MKHAIDKVHAVDLYHHLWLNKPANGNGRLISELNQEIPVLENKSVQAYNNVTLLPMAEGVEDLLKIAKKEIEKAKDSNPILRMVIPYELSSRKRSQSEIMIDNSVEHWVDDFDFFTIQTAEKVDEKFYLYTTTLRYTRSNRSGRSLSKWIISGRTRGLLIPKENIEL